MYQSTFYILLIYIVLAVPNTQAENIKPYLKLDTFLFSETSSIKNILDNNQDDYKRGGRNQYASVWLEAGIKKGAWTATTLYREEHRYTFSPDTADLYNSISTTHTVDSGRRYDIDLGVERFRSKGLRLAYQFGKPNKFSLQLGGSYFQASHLLSGQLTGSAFANSTSDYDYQIDVDYHYDKEVLFGRSNVTSPDGTGIALDLNSTWTINNKLSISAEVKDVYNKIRWKNAPRTVASATSDIKTIGDDGFVIINPSVQGVHTTEDTFTQRIKPSGNASITYNLDDKKSALLIKSRFYSDRTLTAIGGERRFMKGTVSAALWPTLGAVELGYRNKKISINLGIDDINPSDAHTFWLSLGLNAK